VRRRKAIEFLVGLDKVTQFERFMACDVSSPAFATTPETATALPGELVVVRNTITGSEGAGIQIVPKAEAGNVQAPLYTEYIKKKKEYRVHVWNNEVIDVQEKRRRNGTEHSQIRNTANGYVFCRNNVHPPGEVGPLALAAVAALGRSYGGVDIIWNAHYDKCYVLEVNSRPGMEGTTVERYVEAILK
jgi:glutathione synthase/RimK-type ligase-like ATP-grasp enzyme